MNRWIKRNIRFSRLYGDANAYGYGSLVGLIYTVVLVYTLFRHAFKPVQRIKTFFRKLTSYTSKIKQTSTDRVAFISIAILAFAVIGIQGSTVHFQEGGVFGFFNSNYHIDGQAAESDFGLISGSYSDDPTDTILTALNDTTLLGGISLEDAVEQEQIENAPVDQIITHTVTEGETLSQIAAQYDLDVPTIMVANGLSNANSLRLGQKLDILPVKGVLYTVASGDNVSAIAHAYGVTADEIIEYNNLGDHAHVGIGQQLILPGAVQPISRSTTVRSKLPLKKVATGGSGIFIIPVNGILTQGAHGRYGARDIAADTGTPIYASAAGTVKKAPTSGWHGGYGLYVKVDHPNGCSTVYAHASRIYVAPGETVAQGQHIADVGSSGRSTGPHVHFEVQGGCGYPL